MKLKLLGLVFGCFIGSSNVLAQSCGTQSGTSYTFDSNISTHCVPATNVSAITVNSGITVNGLVNGQSILEIYPGPYSINSISNSGTIDSSGVNAPAMYVSAFNNPIAVALLTNYSTGIIRGTYTIDVESGAEITRIDNHGLIYGTLNPIGSWGGVIGNLNNYKTIQSQSEDAIYNSGGSYGNISNYSQGVVQGGVAKSAIFNDGSFGATSTIASITNLGSLLGGIGGYGINNTGTIGTLNNAQGAGNPNGALTYFGVLPTNYNIILGSSAASYGKLSYQGGGGTTLSNFGINSGAVSSKIYAGVLNGITAVTNGRTGTYGGYSYQLSLESGSTTIWDLLFPGYVPIPLGPSTADTQASLQNTASSLQGIYTLQNSVLANSFSYDCNVFGANDVCISAGGRNSAVSAANGLNNTSALLIAGYRINPQYRVGAYADQNLSVNNAGSGVMLGNNTPLIGIFGAWNERTGELGTEVKVSAAYGQKNTTITRAVVGTSEAGSGGSQLNSQGAQVVAKYGFGIANSTVVSPYAGVRYTQNNMGGYTEAASSAVTAPLTYSALNTNATTVLAGAIATYKGATQTTLFASAGVESDTNTSNGSLSATGVSGLTPVNFNSNPVKTRPTASIGAYYDIEKNQRLGISGIYRQEAYQAVQTTTVMATYTIGL